MIVIEVLIFYDKFIFILYNNEKEYVFLRKRIRKVYVRV